jgi:ABC-2 type transport system permease protein
MSLRNAMRAMPTLLRVGFAESIAYRAEMLVWVLSTTMPLIMMALWTAVAREAPVGRFTSQDFVAYFLGAFVVRQISGAWAAWVITFEVRQGTLAMRLLRPISPLWSYAAENIAFMPLKLLVTVPVALLSVAIVGPQAVPRTVWGFVAFLLSLVGAWCITFLANVAIGTLSLYMESSNKVMDVWLALYFVCSGYLYPLKVFPPWAQELVRWLPFYNQLGLPVDLMTDAPGGMATLGMLARQWLWVGLMLVLALTLWRRGLKRFSAFGG